MSLVSASDDSGDLERSLDEALAEDNSKFSPLLVEEPDQPEPPMADGAAFHKAAPPANCRPVAAPVVSSRGVQRTEKHGSSSDWLQCVLGVFVDIFRV